MHTLRKFTLLAILVSACGASGAQTLDMQGTAPAASPDRPTRGMTQDNVQARYGNPESRIAPVGDPPIARWEYPGFIVYFEYDKVIHSVVKRR